MPHDAMPVLAGRVLPRPTSAPESREQVGETVVLGNGSLRRYSSGTRRVWELSWARLTDANRATVEAAYTDLATTYTHVNGLTAIVLAEPPQITPLAGTDPVRFQVEITLREQTPRR